MLDHIERHWHTQVLTGGEVEPWAVMKERFDGLLVSEPAPPSEEDERLELLGLR